jgi:hypothetical protein
MRATLIVIGILLIAIALRTAKRAWVRKLGAVGFLVASYAACFFLFGTWWGGMLGILLWLFLPWVEIFTRIRTMRLPMDHRMQHTSVPNPAFFPNAPQCLKALDEAGFEHSSDCGWHWSGIKQYCCMFLDPSHKTLAILSLCEQSDVVFSFVSISSVSSDGTIFRTTNYPFAPTLKYPKKYRWNHVPCSRHCFRQILASHEQFLQQQGSHEKDLQSFDPDLLEDMTEEEMHEMIEHNLDHGIIEFAGDGFFSYSTKGLFYLWGQFIKDMVRLC